MEHHSSILPWRELPGVTVEMVPEDNFGRVDVKFLEGRLAKAKSNSTLLIGVFSAASNVSGTLNDDVAITKILRKYGALAFWDYATAAPYVDINMNPEKGAKKHAVYFSMHKFLGGVQGPGVLVAKKSIFTNPVPHNGK